MNPAGSLRSVSGLNTKTTQTLKFCLNNTTTARKKILILIITSWSPEMRGIGGKHPARLSQPLRICPATVMRLLPVTLQEVQKKCTKQRNGKVGGHWQSKETNEHPKDGIRLHASNFQAIGQQLSELLQSGNSFRLKVEPWRERRSLSQNSIQHLWYAEMSRYLIAHGRPFASAEWVKDAMKHTYLGYEETERVDVITGERTVIQTLRHTSRLDTGEMHDYLTKVEGWARSIGCLLTVPDNSEYRELQRKQDE